MFTSSSALPSRPWSVRDLSVAESPDGPAVSAPGPGARSLEERSVWALSSLAVPLHSPLDHDIRADVCVIGAGIVGLTAAYELSRVGRSVVVLEKGDLADGVLGVTTAHLSSAFDIGYAGLEGLIGSQAAQLVAESRTSAISAIAEIAKTEGIDCDFERVDSTWFPTERPGTSWRGSKPPHDAPAWAMWI